MSIWSPAQFLKNIPAGLMTQAVTHTRVAVVNSVTGYYPITYGEAGLKGRIRPPGLGKRDVRQAAAAAVGSGHAKAPIGTLYLPAGTDARHKDRFVVEGRTYDAVSVLAHSEETKRRVAVREVHLPERELWLALAPADYDGSAVSFNGQPELVRVLPVPFITDDPVMDVDDRNQVSRLKQLDCAEISRDAFSADNLRRLVYALVVMTGVTPTPEDAVKVGAERVYAHYRFNGAPALENYGWATEFCYRVGLVETDR